MNHKFTRIIKHKRKPRITKYEIQNIKQQNRIIILTFAIVFLTFGQVLVNFLMWHQMRKQTTNLDSTLVRVDTSIGISKRGLEFSRETATKQLRAYINAEIISPKGIETINNRLAIKFGFVNYGQTPAHWVNISGQIQRRKYPDFRNSIVYDSTANQNSRWLVFPNTSTTTTSTGWIYSDSTLRNITEKEIRAMLSTNFRIYFFARIWYRDISDSNQATYICRFIDSVAVKKDGSVDKVHWTDYKDHNSYDREK